MEEQQTVNRETINYLKSIILSQLLLETNDELSHTDRYKQNLKHQLNKSNKILESVVRNQFDILYKSDGEMANNILNKIDTIVEKIAKYQIEELVILEAVVEKYENNKEWFLEHTASEFLKID